MQKILKLNALAFIIPLAFYFYTCAPTMGLGDIVLLLDSIVNFHITTHVNNHPLTVVFGHIFSYLPIPDITYRVSLVSVLIGSLTIFVFFKAIYEEFNRYDLALVSSAALMVSHSMWWHSTIIENYAFNALSTSLFILMLVKFNKTNNILYLQGLFFVSSLAVFNHVQMSFLGAASILCLVFSLVRMKNNKLKTLTSCAIATLLGATPWLSLFLYEVYTSGNFFGTLSGAFLGSFEHIMLKGTWANGLLEVCGELIFQIPNFYLIFIIFGLLPFVKRWGISPTSTAILFELTANTYFFMFYNTWDRYAFLLPSFVVLIFIGSFGIFKFVNTKYSKLLLISIFLSLGFGPYLYSNITEWARDEKSIFHARHSNYHSPNTHRSNLYITNPNKRDFYDVDSFVRILFDKLPANSTYIDDDSRTYFPVWFYQNFYKLRPDVNVNIINSWDIENWGLSKDSYMRALETAYISDRPLFIPNLGAPYYYFNEYSLKYRTYRFEKYDLDDKRWIYKLITQSQQKLNKNTDSNTIIPLSSEGPHDVQTQNVGLTKGVIFENQVMRNFEGTWLSGDHLFVRGLEEGAFVEILLDAPHPIKAPIEFNLTTGPDFGAVSISCNDNIIIPSMDLYSESVSTITVQSEQVSCSTKICTFKFTFIGKNPKSKGNILGIDFIRILE